ncbi:unnamed protein product [Trichobilharzia regenti]|nr:unnamed protein product [Trichobilharzia regenti]
MLPGPGGAIPTALIPPAGAPPLGLFGVPGTQMYYQTNGPSF